MSAPLPVASAFIYIISNPYQTGVKIGWTRDLAHRLASLYNTSVPAPFVCEHAWQCASPGEARAIERRAHEALAPVRIGEDREFFALSVEAAADYLQKLAGEPTYSRREQASRAGAGRMDPPDNRPWHARQTGCDRWCSAHLITLGACACACPRHRRNGERPSNCRDCCALASRQPS